MQPATEAGEAAGTALAEKLAFLHRPASYPERPAAVEVRETHMSWVFLTGRHVYKLKKPVRFPYLDFSTLARREAACRAELELNRRLAPEVYLGILPLTVGAEGLELGGQGPVADWLVAMRRLPEEGSLEAAIRAGGADPAAADRVAARLGRFYRHARRMPIPPHRLLKVWRTRLAEIRESLLQTGLHLPRGTVRRVVAVLYRFLALRSFLVSARAGRILDAHGDLRPEHVWLTRPVAIIDCLEFDPGLRALDPLDEIAFLDLECERLGAPALGRRLRRRVAAALRESPPQPLYLFYRCYRALLRARLAAAHLLEPDPRTPEKWPRLARRYLALAGADSRKLQRLLRTPSGR